MNYRQFFLACTLPLAGLYAAAADVTPQPDGTVSLPYFEDFATDEYLDLLEIVDVNNDGRTWMWSDIVYDMRNRASEDNDADDWLMLPPMRMEAGKSYELTFSARAVYSMYTERLEVKLGEGMQPAPEDMTVTLIPAVDVVPRTDMRAVITVEHDGVYRIGFHAISRAGAFRLALDDIRVASPLSALRPGVPADGSVTPGAPGELKATLSFKVPSLTVNGKPLTEIDRLTVTRDGVSVKEYPTPVPGTAIELEAPTVQGVNTFTIVGANSHGEGEPLVLKVFTGDDVPLPPDNVRMEVRDGKAYLTWDAPTIGENGGFIDPSTLTYEIQRRSDFEYVERSYAGTSYVDELPSNINSRPRQLFYCIRAISHGGKSLDSGDSNRFITGDSMELPFSESFAGMNYDNGHYWHSINEGERWNLDNTLVFDNDGGAAKFAPANMGENSLFYTSRLSLNGSSHPLLTFYYWNVKNSDMILEVMVSRENGEFETLRTFDFSDNHDVTGWQKGSVLLDAYTDAGYVLVGWKATAGGIQTVTALDAVEICDVPASDLGVTLSAPAVASEGQPVMLTATVSNFGATDASAFNVVLSHESFGEVERRTCDLLPVGATAEFEFSLPFRCAPGLKNGSYIVKVEWNGDVDYSNDTDRAVISLRPGRMPAPSALTGYREDGAIRLEWEAPDMTGPVTDDMESYEPFLIAEFGDWITIDRDRQLTYRIVEPQLDDENEQISYITLDYPNAGEPMAFQVFNPFEAGSSVAEGMCRSGRQALASFAAVKEHNDDWLISPELSGQAQTVSFYARSGGASQWGCETLEVWWSAELQEPEKFTLAVPETEIPNGEWMEIRAALPEGARHFAVHCTSEIVMMLLIDDVTYIPKAAEAVLTGYNVYRNGVLLNSRPIETTSFTDPVVDEEAVYHVKAVYADGVSSPSNYVAVADIHGSGLDMTDSDKVVVIAKPGCIVVTDQGALDAEVFNITGRKICGMDGCGTLTLPIGSGVYIVKVNSRSFKVLVP